MADSEQWLLVGDELRQLDRLVYMVVPDVFRGRADLVPPAGSALRQTLRPVGGGGPGGQERMVEALYELLAAHELSYDLDPRDPAGVERQKVRQPREVFAGRRGNCVDLALVFCGMALEAQLFPVLAVMLLPDRSRHTVVLIAPQSGDDRGSPPDCSLDERQGTADELRLAELLMQGWIAVDVTRATSDVLAGTSGSGTFAEARHLAWSALKSARDIRTLDVARRQSAAATPFRAEELPPPYGQAYSSALRDRYGPRLAHAGIVPVEWNAAELHALRSRHRAEQPSPSPVGDILEALCAALQARPVFDSVGGDDFALATLRHLYADHVGQAPRDAYSADELLVLAAAAGIAEFRSGTRQAVGPLARFLLGVAGHADDPEGIDLGSARYALLDAWLTDILGHLREDARRYLLNEVRRRTWALMELVGCSSTAAAGPPWPRGVVVDLVDPLGNVTTRNFPCRERSELGLKNALRRATTTFLPGRAVAVDLVVPREWLDVGLEHWDVVDVGGAWDPMTRDLRPRMRWSGFKHDRLRERLETRLRKADWHGAPAVVPEAVAGDRTSTAAWLDDASAGPGQSPYLVSCPPPRGGDPLDVLLTEGCGFIVWFTTHHEETNLQAACVQSNGEETSWERRSSLPRQLAERLDKQRTTVIWNDPQGRDGFPMPLARRSGSLRSGGSR
ncbi:hypothetical protein GCM10010271_72350 [Streptomyces kurssanovii]|nr:hypothetical protein GCM10010271_72350 [Streptomyces kurssanovii]